MTESYLNKSLLLDFIKCPESNTGVPKYPVKSVMISAHFDIKKMILTSLFFFRVDVAFAFVVEVVSDFVDAPPSSWPDVESVLGFSWTCVLFSSPG